MPQAPSRARSSPLQSPLHLLHRASQRADSLFSGHAGNSLTPRQFVVLQAVAEADGLSQTGIMAATGIDRSSTADLVRRLVSHGLAAASPHETRRTAVFGQAYGGRAARLVPSRACRARDGGHSIVAPCPGGTSRVLRGFGNDRTITNLGWPLLARIHGCFTPAIGQRILHGRGPQSVWLRLSAASHFTGGAQNVRTGKGPLAPRP
jgi:hypothetical protein